MTASALVTGGFIVLPLLVAAGFVGACDWAGRRLGRDVAARRRRTTWIGIAVLGWLAVTALAGASGVLRRFDLTPPPFALFILAVVIIGAGVPFSSLGTLLVRGLPLWALVGSQVFRLPLELVMHQALGLWLARGRPPRWIVMAWNALGFALLLNVVTIAIVSTPPFRWFGDAHVNVFVTYAPFVWLPAVLVTAALMSHLLVWRRLRAP